MNIMDNLAQIDWASMGSPDIPKWTQDLLSDDLKERTTALHNLIVHLAPFECTDCLFGCEEADRLEIMKRETAFQLIPLLIELLRADNVRSENKLSILSLMENLLDWRRTQDCLTEEAVQNVFRPYMKRLHDAISQGIDIYKQLTNADSKWVREEANAVLEYLET